LQEFSRFVRVAAIVSARWRAGPWNPTLGNEAWADLTTR
jgi:hypothetical protein